jgi:hypothetical protein
MRVTNVLSGAASLLSFLTYTQAAAIPQSSNNMTSTSSSGYKNVAYFVNWVRPLIAAPPTHTNTLLGYLWP